MSNIIPYWDWTSDASVPQLASNEAWQWKDGPVKFGVGFEGHENVSARGPGYLDVFKNESFTKHMQKLTQIAYCSHCFEEYQFLIQFPHNLVHNGFHGVTDPNFNEHLSNMEDTTISAYDPVFFMHHMMVDRQYAYYQALQEHRKKLVQHPENPHMPPYSGILRSEQQGNFPTDVPNPYPITQNNSRPNDGLNYKDVFEYKYDTLSFKGMSPSEFDLNTQCGNASHAGIHFRTSKPARFEIFAIKGAKSEKVGHYAVLTPTESDLLVPYDVTSAL